MRHGHGGKESEVDGDSERFFRAVDRAVLEYHSQPAGTPLILAALPMHHHLFRHVSRNPFLISQGIDVHPDALPSVDELRLRAWQLMEPRELARLAVLVEEFGNARSEGGGDDDLAELAKAAVAGRISKLLLEARRDIAGRIDSATGDLRLDNPTLPGVDGVLDDLATLTMRTGGQVVFVPAERMPTKTGAAGIYRY